MLTDLAPVVQAKLIEIAYDLTDKEPPQAMRDRKEAHAETVVKRFKKTLTQLAHVIEEIDDSYVPERVHPLT